MKYTYKMIQIPPNISVDAKKHKGSEAAAYLQDEVNTQARNGWEFQRVDQIGVSLQPGCLAGFFGQKAQLTYYYVISFRKEVDD
ncbi:DUF4177 domain-containing protein [Castellaniella ginsengisoli]|uniref:DUF4177 domain-containing protein n=1 Tax=Castellaniella ginsengisoli TaxID=546114 RepID=A0AB39D3Z2_9BURK